MVLRILKTAFRLRDRHAFMWQSLKILNVFIDLNLKQVFWKTKNTFKKLGYRFLVANINIENVTFPYKTALSEANAKTDRMGSRKWSYYKERSFVNNYFIFLKIRFSIRISYNDLMYQLSECLYSYYVRINFRVLFPCEH